MDFSIIHATFQFSDCELLGKDFFFVLVFNRHFRRTVCNTDGTCAQV